MKLLRVRPLCTYKSTDVIRRPTPFRKNFVQRNTKKKENRVIDRTALVDTPARAGTAIVKEATFAKDPPLVEQGDDRVQIGVAFRERGGA